MKHIITERAEETAEAKRRLREVSDALNAARNRVIELEREEKAASEAYQKSKAALMRELG